MARIKKNETSEWLTRNKAQGRKKNAKKKKNVSKWNARIWFDKMVSHIQKMCLVKYMRIYLKRK